MVPYHFLRQHRGHHDTTRAVGLGPVTAYLPHTVLSPDCLPTRYVVPNRTPLASPLLWAAPTHSSDFIFPPFGILVPMCCPQQPYTANSQILS